MKGEKVSLDAIKALREKTSAPLNDVRQALASACGDEAKAMELLRQRGAAIAEKRKGHTAGQGRVETYVHHDGRMAAMVEVNCETDFVARTSEFIQFCRDVAVQVAAMGPRYVRKEDAPAGEAQEAEGAVPWLVGQPFVKDPSKTIGELLTSLIAQTGERVVIRRFVRFTLGDATDRTP